MFAGVIMYRFKHFVEQFSLIRFGFNARSDDEPLLCCFVKIIIVDLVRINESFPRIYNSFYR